MVSLFEAQTAQDVIDAVARGDDVNEVQFWLPDDNGEGSTPLLTACTHGRTEVVQALLEHGANPHDEDFTYSTILYATVNGYRDIIVLLLNAGVNINVGNGEYWGTPLFIAARFGHIDCLDLLLEQGADIEARNEDGYTPLMIACIKKRVDAIERLLQYGANVNAIQEYDGESWCTVLQHACIAGDLAIVDRLILYGADYRLFEDKDKLSGIRSPEVVKRISDLLGK